MRVTSLMMVDNAIQHMSESMETLSLLQEKASTGKLIRTPSDDPSVAVTGLSLRSTLATHTAYKDTAQVTLDWLDSNEQYMDQMVTLGKRALELSKQGVSDTMNVQERNAIANDIEGVIQNLVGAANGSTQGKYLFAGYAVNGGAGGVPPFQYTAGNPAVTTTTAHAATQQMSHTIERGQTIPVNWDYAANWGTAVPPAQPTSTLEQVFTTMIDVRDALKAAPFDTTTLTTAIANLNTAVTSLATDRTTNGDRVRQTNMALDRMEKTGNALKNLLSHKEDANLAETISQLKLQETIYQSVLSVGQRAITPSLFDFLK